MRYKKRTDKFKSGFEATIAKQLTAAGTKADYEPDKYSFYVPETGRACGACGETKYILRKSSYRPDFKIRKDVYVEAKGRLTSQNRKRLVAFRERNPSVTVYIVYQRDNYLTSNKRAKYTDWAKEAGFDCSVGKIKKEWLE